MTEIERMELKRCKDEEYWSMKRQWETFSAQQELNFAKWRDNKVQISEWIGKKEGLEGEVEGG